MPADLDLQAERQGFMQLTASMTDPNLGRKLANRYEIVETLGQGSMGKVYLAEDSLLGGVPVAVKFLVQTLLSDKMKERFMREAMTCAQLGQKSIHVVRVSDYGVTEDEIPFYVMEYLKGKSLGHVELMIYEERRQLLSHSKHKRNIILGAFPLIYSKSQ